MKQHTSTGGRDAPARAVRTRARDPRRSAEGLRGEGYEGASLATIARAADITKPGLLHHFGSKAELFTAVLDERDRRAVSLGVFDGIGACAKSSTPSAPWSPPTSRRSRAPPSPR